MINSHKKLKEKMKSWISFKKKFSEWLNLIKMLGWNHILIWTQIWEKKAKNEFEKDFFKLIKNAILRKATENVKKYRYIKLFTAEKRRNYLALEPNYHTKTFFMENLLVMKGQRYLWISLLILIWLCNDEKAKLCFIDTKSSILYIKIGAIYKYIPKNAEIKFDTLN